MEVKSDKRDHAFKKLNKELIDSIVNDIANGSTHRYAAESHAVSETMFNLWRKQGMLDLQDKPDSLPAYLVVSLANVKKAEVMRCRQQIAATEKGHKGAEWTLEKAYWRDFGQQAALKELAAQMDAMAGKSKTKEEYHGEVESSESE